MKTNWFKRTLCSILAFVMVLGYVPATAFASEADGLCEHHTQHTTECGYSAAVAGHDCGHEHTDECYQSVTECVHVHGDCGYVAAVEGHSCDCQPDENGEIVHTEGCGYVEAVAEVSCGHVCSEESGCIKKVLNCQHIHDGDCGYVEATAEVPCAYDCEECAQEPLEPDIAMYSFDTTLMSSTGSVTCEQVTAKVLQYKSIIEQWCSSNNTTTAYWNAHVRSASSSCIDGKTSYSDPTGYIKSRVNEGDYTSYLTATPCPGGSHSHGSNTCYSNEFGAAHQCNGYANYMNYVVFGLTHKNSNGSVTSGFENFNFVPGDIAIYSKVNSPNIHFRYVYDVDDTYVYYVAGNDDGRCGICFRKMEIAEARNGYYTTNAFRPLSEVFRSAAVDADTVRGTGSGGAVIELPSVPTNFTATYIDDERANLSWSASAGATSYEVQYWSPTGNVWKTDTNYSSGTSYISSGLRDYSSWRFRVRAVNSAGASEWVTYDYEKTHTHTFRIEFESIHPHKEYRKCYGCGLIEYTGRTTKVDNCAQCLSVAVPAAPNNFSVVYVDNERANLSWLPSVGATSYEAQYWSPGSNAWKTDTSYSNGTSYTSSGLKNYDSWKFRVRAKNSAGVSDWTTCVYNKADYSTITGYCGASGTNLSYAIANDGVLTIYGSGSMAGYTGVSPDGTMGTPAPWYNDRYKIKTVVIQPGVTSIGTWAFYGCTNMTAISIPETVTDINEAAFFSCIDLRSIRLPSSISRTENLIFANCTGLSSVILPENLNYIGDNTFMGCQSLTSITIPNSVRSIGTAAFERTGLKDVYYNCTKMHWKTITIGNYNSPLQNANMHYDSWASAVRSVFIACPVDVEILDTEDRIVHVLEDGKEWSTHTDYGHFAVYTDDNDESVKYFDIVEGYSFRIRGTDFGSMTVSYSENEGEILTVSNIPVVPSMVATIDGGDVPILMIDKDADGTSEESIPMDTGIPSSPDNVKLHADELGLKVSDEVWVDGEKCIVQSDNDGLYVALPDANARTMVTYSYNNPNAADVHTKYPIGMKVWKLKQENGVYTATYVPELDNLLQYSGSSIRITGNKGIRMITSVNQDTRNKLTGSGLAGFKLLEYGTLLAQTSKLGNNPLVLGGGEYVKSNYAYKKGVADPVFKYANGLIQYTNVLVGFTDEQCKEDIAMRPYMKLEDENGEEFVIYGGIVYRSIGYIAYQNRNAFQPSSAAYEYVWSIIHNVYDNQYDDEYKK